MALSRRPFGKLTLTASAPINRACPANPVTLGDRLKSKRILNELSVKAVCRILKIPTSTLHRWESNRITPKSRNVKKIKDFLGS